MPKKSSHSEFERWYTNQFGRLPNVELIHQLKEEVPALKARYETSSAALRYELDILETFDTALKAYYARDKVKR